MDHHNKLAPSGIAARGVNLRLTAPLPFTFPAQKGLTPFLPKIYLPRLVFLHKRGCPLFAPANRNVRGSNPPSPLSSCCSESPCWTRTKYLRGNFHKGGSMLVLVAVLALVSFYFFVALCLEVWRVVTEKWDRDYPYRPAVTLRGDLRCGR